MIFIMILQKIGEIIMITGGSGLIINKYGKTEILD